MHYRITIRRIERNRRNWHKSFYPHFADDSDHQYSVQYHFQWETIGLMWL